MTVPALAVEALTVDLGGRRVLTDVNLSINHGEFAALIGPNGAGKTTLLRSILGLLPTLSGHVHINGDTAHRHAIGYVPQRHEFAWDFPLTVREAVVAAFAGRLRWGARPRLEHFEAVEEALEQTQLVDLADRPVGELSGGQRQRVLIARALALRPQILLLDEPFTGLDMPTQEQLTDMLRRVSHQGQSILMTTHDLIGALAVCDHLFLVKGRIIAHGPASELSTPEPWISTFGIRPDHPLLQAVGVVDSHAEEGKDAPC